LDRRHPLASGPRTVQKIFIAYHVGEDGTRRVHHSDVVGLEPLHATRHQVDHGLNLLRAQLFPRGQTEENGGRGGFLLLQKKLLLGDDDAHPGKFHSVELLDGAPQLPFQGAQPGDSLMKVAHAHLGLVEELVTHPSPLGESSLGQG